MQATANVNGKISPANEATISISDRGFQYGDSIYEVTRTYSGVPFYMDEHFERLENSARLARMKISQTREELKKEIRRTVEASQVKKGEDVFIRYTITRGEGPLDLDPASAPRTSYVILVKEIPPWKKEFYTHGMILAIPQIVRNSPLALEPNIKSGNYLNNILALAEAKQMGGDDALILSLEGKITEASNSNVAFVLDGKLISPLHEPASHTGNLRGITKTVIALIAKKLSIKFEERAIFPEEINQASECFVSSATREVMPVAEVIFQNSSASKIFSSGGGPITRSVQSAYGDFVRSYVLDNKDGAWF